MTYRNSSRDLTIFDILNNCYFSAAMLIVSVQPTRIYFESKCLTADQKRFGMAVSPSHTEIDLSQSLGAAEDRELVLPQMEMAKASVR